MRKPWAPDSLSDRRSPAFPDAALGDAGAVRGNEGGQASDHPEVHLEGVQVPGVDSDEPGARRDGVGELLLGVDLHERLEAGVEGLSHHGAELRAEDPGDEERPARAVGPGHVELDRVEDEVLAQHGHDSPPRRRLGRPRGTRRRSPARTARSPPRRPRARRPRPAARGPSPARWLPCWGGLLDLGHDEPTRSPEAGNGIGRRGRSPGARSSEGSTSLPSSMRALRRAMMSSRNLCTALSQVVVLQEAQEPRRAALGHGFERHAPDPSRRSSSTPAAKSARAVFAATACASPRRPLPAKSSVSIRAFSPGVPPARSPGRPSGSPKSPGRSWKSRARRALDLDDAHGAVEDGLVVASLAVDHEGALSAEAPSRASRHRGQRGPGRRRPRPACAPRRG